MGYKLHYFPFRGRAEQARLLFHALDVAYEEVRIVKSELMKLKKQGPGVLLFGSLPLLEDGELKLVQGPAIMQYIGNKHGAAPLDAAQNALANAITLGAEDMRTKYFGLFGEGAEEKQKAFLEGDWKSRWLPAFAHALDGGGGHMIGGMLSYADIAVWDVLNAFVSYIDGSSFDGFDSVKSFYDEIAGLSTLEKYLAERPE